MKKSTIVLIVLATLLSAIGIYFLFYKLACKGGHSMASRGCCCCSSYGSGGTGQGQTSVLGSGRLGTIVLMPPGVVLTPTDSLIISVAGYSNQPVYFEVTKPEGSTVTPTLYIYKKNSSGTWVPNGYITEGIYTINNNASSLREYAFIVKYDGAVNFDALTFYPETDLHGFDASYSKEGVTATLRVH